MSNPVNLLMNTAAVNQTGGKIQEIGAAISRYIKEFDETTEYITANGIKGAFQTSLSTAHEEVSPGMNKEAQGVSSLGTAIQTVAQNTEATDAELASTIKVQSV